MALTHSGEVFCSVWIRDSTKRWVTPFLPLTATSIRLRHVTKAAPLVPLLMDARETKFEHGCFAFYFGLFYLRIFLKSHSNDECQRGRSDAWCGPLAPGALHLARRSLPRQYRCGSPPDTRHSRLKKELLLHCDGDTTHATFLRICVSSGRRWGARSACAMWQRGREGVSDG